MGAPHAILDLVERFDRNVAAYRSGAYNETQARREFIDPFFKALGWDIDNEAGYAEAYKDVVHEDAIKVGGLTKAPDYCFRVGGTRKFFVEAKKPSVNIRDEVSPAYQLRRYAWSAKLPLSILTDFEELAVYDCRVKPDKSDAAAVARTIYLRYGDYAEKWAQIASVFSREAVLQGSFDRYAESTKAKKGTAEVDAIFLKEIESWRDLLARTIALRNPALSQRELNYAVQTTIDRIIFLRICEDRGIEPYGRLQGLLNGEGTYARLRALYIEADQRYNSGLFHFERERGREQPDELTPGLAIDDKALKEIVKRLYYPDSPYEFSVLPADILGQVYEQFLGKVIRLTAGHRAVVEDKPEVKKAGGVYYTPTYIVDYIVKQTVGKLLEDTTPKQAASLRILDPACGSGSFLIGAYQYLADWHRDWYVEHGPEKHRKELYQGRGGEWRLTTAEKKRILLGNIYGVDIDAQAVETTKLSLLLKVLEGESSETISSQLKLVHERALPDLAANIKCGNSLIGPDFYDDQQLGLLQDEDERYRINVFDWEAEFPQILGKAVPEEKRGFDAVIGNPPYVRQESLADAKQYLQRRYSAYQGTADLYVYFIERGTQLLRPQGLFSIIVSSSFLRAAFGQSLRRYLQQGFAVEEFVDFGGLAVFEKAKDTYVCIPLVRRGPQPAEIRVTRVAQLRGPSFDGVADADGYQIPAARLSDDSWNLDSEDRVAMFRRIRESSQPLGDVVGGGIYRGIITGLNAAFEIDDDTRTAMVGACPDAQQLIHAFLGGQEIRRYHVRAEARFLIVIPCGWTNRKLSRAASGGSPSESRAWSWLQDNYAPIARHLAPLESRLRERGDQGDYWWELRPCDYYHVLEAPKLIYPDIAKGPRFFLDESGTYISNTAYCLASSDWYLLGLLNSRLAWFLISQISIPFGTRAGEYRYRLFFQYMEQVPVFWPDRPSQDQREAMGNLRQLAQTRQGMQQGSSRASTPDGHARRARELQAVDARIDRLVYDLYGLTDDEIALVESSFTEGK